MRCLNTSAHGDVKDEAPALIVGFGSQGEGAMNDTRQHAHELIDRLRPTQLVAFTGLLEVILDPVPPGDRQRASG